MAYAETMTNHIIYNMMSNVGMQPYPEKCPIIEVQDALKTASKRMTGKRGAPEFIAKVRAAMAKAKVSYQMAELGKVDQGGGGTIAYHAAKYGMNVLDAGVAVLSMHAPWEITSKEDICQMFEAYKAFLKIEA